MGDTTLKSKLDRLKGLSVAGEAVSRGKMSDASRANWTGKPAAPSMGDLVGRVSRSTGDVMGERLMVRGQSL
jgi:hypothetical protein